MRTFVDRIAHRPGPVLRWEGGPDGTLELTGPVLANWVHKASGLLEDTGVGPDTGLGLVDGHGLHWRALAGAIAAWGLGACVRSLEPTGAGPASSWTALAHEDWAQAEVTSSAEEVLVYPSAPLALSVDVPAGFTDFVSALRAYPDQAPLSETSTALVGGAGALERLGLSGLREAGDGRGQRETLVDSLPASAEQWSRVLGGLAHGLLVLDCRVP